MTLTAWLQAAETFIPKIVGLEAGIPATETIPAETVSLNLGPLGTFSVSTPSFPVTIKKG